VKPVQEWVDQVVEELEGAFAQFGRYTFYDKGPHEVMFIDEYADQLKELAGAEAGAYLEALSKGAHEGAPNVAQAILGQCDDMPDDWWEACCEAAPSVDY
jgi:hypothetical protein